jgi:alpha-L-fucosidase
MKMKPWIMGFLSLAFFSINSVASPEAPQLTETPEQREERIQWFRDAKFGLFIHWGPSAISGEEISWGMMDRIEGGDHHKKVPRNEYMNLYRRFNPVKWNPDALFGLAADAGMKYAVFVTKHHDGFSMWPTKQTRFPGGAEFPVHYSIADTPYRKDPVRMVQQAARKHGMKLGWYYSTRDWTHPDYLQGDNKIYNDYYENQVMELMEEYGPVDLMWFDHTFGMWDNYTIPRLFGKMYSKNPRLLVNDRAARGLPDIPRIYQALDHGDFTTPENRMGSFQYGRAWESCMILSPHADHGGWSYRPDGVTRSLTETLRLLSSAAAGDGNMLLNLAPLPDGSLRPEEEAVLKGIVPWMRKHGEAIHGTRGGPWRNGSWGGATNRGKTVYLHIFEPGEDPVNLRALPQKVIAATSIDGIPAPFKQTASAVSVTIPKAVRDPHVTVLKLTLDQPVTAPLDGPAFADQVEDDPPGTMVFKPATARLEGGLQAQERGGVSSIGYWTNPEGSATWDVGINRPATYQILLSISNSRAGAELFVEIAGKSFTLEVPNTGDHDQYKTVDAGKITFPNAEQTELRVSVADKGSWHPTNIRSVKMLPSSR